MEGSSEMLQRSPGSTALVEVEQSRAIAEIQAAMVIAKRFPRVMAQVEERVCQEFTRPTLCTEAVYSFPRGGTEVSGLSIRAAEVLIRQFGNADYGIRELARRPGESEMEAWCFDRETNVTARRQFLVPHIIDTRRGPKNLTDARDIYEHTYNMGARRLRACILEIVPGDLQEAALRQIDETLEANADTSPEAIKKLVKAFDEIGVTQRQLENLISRKIESVRPAQILRLRRIFASIRDEMSSPGDWFGSAAETAAADAVAETVVKATQQRPATVPEPKEEPTQEAATEEPQKKVERIETKLRKALIKEVEGIGAAVLESLEEAGYNTAEKIASATSDDLSKLKNIGVARAQRIISFCGKWADVAETLGPDSETEPKKGDSERVSYLRELAEEHGAHWGQVVAHSLSTYGKEDFDDLSDLQWEALVKWVTSAKQEDFTKEPATPASAKGDEPTLSPTKISLITDSMRKMYERMDSGAFDKLSDDFDQWLRGRFGGTDLAHVPASGYHEILSWLSERQP